jgi:hypothetical protein
MSDDPCVKIGLHEDVPSELLRRLSSACFSCGFSVHYFSTEAAADLPEVFNNIDWQELREQKEWLAAIQLPQAIGLVGLLDHFQDCAVAAGIPEQEVFGPPTPDAHKLPDGWFAEFNRLSWCEGWLLGGHDDGNWAIQKLDEPDEGVREFGSDCEALAFVTAKALAGSALHMLALFLDGRKDKGYDGDGDIWVPLAMVEAVSGK